MNDIFSINKELKDGVKDNIVAEIQRHFGFSSARAMHLAHKMMCEEQHLFDTSTSELIKSYQHSDVANHVEQYVRGLRD